MFAAAVFGSVVYPVQKGPKGLPPRLKVSLLTQSSLRLPLRLRLILISRTRVGLTAVAAAAEYVAPARRGTLQPKHRSA